MYTIFTTLIVIFILTIVTWKIHNHPTIINSANITLTILQYTPFIMLIAFAVIHLLSRITPLPGIAFFAGWGQGWTRIAGWITTTVGTIVFAIWTYLMATPPERKTHTIGNAIACVILVVLLPLIFWSTGFRWFVFASFGGLFYTAILLICAGIVKFEKDE